MLDVFPTAGAISTYTACKNEFRRNPRSQTYANGNAVPTNSLNFRYTYPPEFFGYSSL